MPQPFLYLPYKQGTSSGWTPSLFHQNSPFFLWESQTSGKRPMSQKDWLKIQFQEAGNQDLDETMIDNLADFKFDYPTTTHDLRHYINNLLGVSKFVSQALPAYVLASYPGWIIWMQMRDYMKTSLKVTVCLGLKSASPLTGPINFSSNLTKQPLTFLK